MSEASNQETSSLFKDFVLSGYRAGSRIGVVPLFLAEAVVKIPLFLLKLIITAPGWLFALDSARKASTVRNLQKYSALNTDLYDDFLTNKVFLVLNIIYSVIFFPVHLVFKLLELIIGVSCGVVGALIGVVVGGVIKLGQVAWYGLQKLLGHQPSGAITEQYDFTDIGKFFKQQTQASFNDEAFRGKNKPVSFGSDKEDDITYCLAFFFRYAQHIVTNISAPCLNTNYSKTLQVEGKTVILKYLMSQEAPELSFEGVSLHFREKYFSVYYENELYIMYSNKKGKMELYERYFVLPSEKIAAICTLIKAIALIPGEGENYSVAKVLQDFKTGIEQLFKNSNKTTEFEQLVNQGCFEVKQSNSSKNK